MANLFSYGSNSPRQLGERLGRAVSGSPASLDGHRRVFRGLSQKWNGGVASLEKKAGATVYGWIAKVSDDDLATLDRYEGVASGNYKRTTITVEGPRGAVKAVAYVSLSREFNKPSRAYLEAVAETISSFWSDDKPISWRSISVNPVAGGFEENPIRSFPAKPPQIKLGLHYPDDLATEAKDAAHFLYAWIAGTSPAKIARRGADRGRVG